ncbi:hypothetical protein, partial [Clostridium botulinum]|uniref:hypothetical protein n=1 Tax=Clostridium botulinum TaxID=1491 RepID=UPI001A930BD5
VSDVWSYSTNEYSRYIGVDKNNNVYHGFSNKLYKFDKDGNVVWSTNSIGGGLIDYIFFDYRNFIYAVTNNQYLNKYNSNGLLIKSIKLPKVSSYVVSSEKDFIYVPSGSDVIKYNFDYKVIS